jgi:hypothetical protein
MSVIKSRKITGGCLDETRNEQNILPGKPAG